MEIKLEIPEYNQECGFTHYWENGFEIKVEITGNMVLISANKAGLISLAIQMLSLAQDANPANMHFHLDEFNSLETGSKELIVQKLSSIP